jgi:hypothetical protein
MQNTTQTETRIDFTEIMSTATRVFLFILGLFPWLAPYELLIKPGWSEFSLAMLFFLVISLGAIAVSLGFIGAAVFGMNQTVTFELTARSITTATKQQSLPYEQDATHSTTLSNLKSANIIGIADPTLIASKFASLTGIKSYAEILPHTKKRKQY